ncbi:MULTISPECIES: hypothetical protein [unclassified Caballeronia]|uniref:hypothetical protein n=1 Tax=unclassified Caballeronia TaxID=2646786 RepID=UPI002029A401|nr:MULTISPECIES: hypothetical protein [unclassified Caballeronia]
MVMVSSKRKATNDAGRPGKPTGENEAEGAVMRIAVTFSFHSKHQPKRVTTV